MGWYNPTPNKELSGEVTICHSKFNLTDCRYCRFVENYVTEKGTSAKSSKCEISGLYFK